MFDSGVMKNIPSMPRFATTFQKERKRALLCHTWQIYEVQKLNKETICYLVFVLAIILEPFPIFSNS